MWGSNGRRCMVSPRLLLLQLLSLSFPSICEKLFDLKGHRAWKCAAPSSGPQRADEGLDEGVAAPCRHTAHAHLAFSSPSPYLWKPSKVAITRTSFSTDLSDEHEPCWGSTWLHSVPCAPWGQLYDILCGLIAQVVKWWLFLSFCIWK